MRNSVMRSTAFQRIGISLSDSVSSGEPLAPSRGPSSGRRQRQYRKEMSQEFLKPVRNDIERPGFDSAFSGS
jgi:hypothetical protein